MKSLRFSPFKVQRGLLDVKIIATLDRTNLESVVRDWRPNCSSRISII